MRRIAVLVLLLLFGAGAARSRAADDSVDLTEGDRVERMARARQLRKTDVPALGRALLAFGRSDDEEDIAFLVDYAVAEHSRALRILAVSAAERIDRAKAFAAFAKRAKESRKALEAAYATEALGYLGDGEDVPTLIELLGRKEELVGLAAADALARVAPRDAADDVVAAGLPNGHEHVRAHVAWAALDLLKSKKAVEEEVEKAVKRRPEAAANAAAIRHALDEATDSPFRWSSSLPAVRRLFRAPPPETETIATNPSMEAWLDEGLGWLDSHRPAEAWLLHTIFHRLSATTSPPEYDYERGSVNLSAEDAGLVPEKQSLLLVRHAVLGLRRALKEPFEGHRGWEAALLDTYDLADVAGVDGVGRAGGATLEHYLNHTLARRPWEAP